MSKNLLIAVLAFALCFLAIAGVALMRTLENAEVDPTVYVGLVTMRDFLPPETYKNTVLPFLEEAMQDNKITRKEMATLHERLNAATGGLGAITMEKAAQETMQEKMQRYWSEGAQTARDWKDDLGHSLSRFFDYLMEEPAPMHPNGQPMPPQPRQQQLAPQEEAL